MSLIYLDLLGDEEGKRKLRRKGKERMIIKLIN